MTTFTPERIQQIAAAIYAKEQDELRKQQERIRAIERAEVAALKEAVRQERIKAEADRIEAQLRAERALAEERARAEKAAMDAAIAAELQRLRNRGPVETLQDEVASLKKTLADMKNGPQMKVITTFVSLPTEVEPVLSAAEVEEDRAAWAQQRVWVSGHMRSIPQTAGWRRTPCRGSQTMNV